MKFLGLALTVLVVVAVIMGWSAFVLMVLIGALHSYHAVIPAIGFWNALLWVMTIGTVGGLFNGSNAAATKS